MVQPPKIVLIQSVQPNLKKNRFDLTWSWTHLPPGSPVIGVDPIPTSVQVISKFSYLCGLTVALLILLLPRIPPKPRSQTIFSLKNCTGVFDPY